MLSTFKILMVQRLLPTLDGGRVPVREYLLINEDLRQTLLNSMRDESPLQAVVSIMADTMLKNKTRMVDALDRIHQQGLISKATYQQNLL